MSEWAKDSYRARNGPSWTYTMSRMCPRRTSSSVTCKDWTAMPEVGVRYSELLRILTPGLLARRSSGFGDLGQERHHLVAVHRPLHGRHPGQQRPAVPSGGQAAVENRHHTPVLGRP